MTLTEVNHRGTALRFFHFVGTSLWVAILGLGWNYGLAVVEDVEGDVCPGFFVGVH